MLVAFFHKYIVMKLNELDKFKLGDAVNFHDQLNPVIFQNENLKPNVRQRLLEIAQDFIEFLGVPELDVKDITISGSNAAYTYTKHSDIDLHVLVDMNKIKNDAIYEELFNAKKNLYNEYHDILIYGFEVELYVQDSNEPVISLGEYSVLNDKWIRIPKKRRSNVDEIAAKLKFEKLGEVAEAAIRSRDEKKIDELLRVIKRYRQAGLDSHGEFGPENLAFKVLRSRGIIDKLYQVKNDLHDERLSLPEDNKLLDKPTPTIEELAKKHKVSTKFIAKQLDKGIKIELEHTNSRKVAKEIASDHLNEDPKYYIKLAKVELEESTEIPRTIYHVTLSKNLSKIKSRGISGDETHCFESKVSVQHALMNWLGSELEEDQEITLLAINTNGLAIKESNRNGYEVAITSRIPPSNIKVVSDLLESILMEDVPTVSTEILYHGSDSEKIKGTLRTGERDAGWFGQGFYLTAYPEYAKRWGKYIYKMIPPTGKYAHVFVTGNYEKIEYDVAGQKANEYAGGNDAWIKDELAWAQKFNEYLIRNGYTGIRVNMDNYQNVEVVVFDPSKITRSSDLPISESASGYIPSKKEANDPRFKTALTVDIKPDTMQKNAAKLGSKIKRNGVPPLLR